VRLLGQINLNITLTKRLPAWAQKSSRKFPFANEGSLTDDAFQPKSFTVRIEEGDFEIPSQAWVPSKFAHLHSGRPSLKFTRRLVFDVSPYPPKSEWKKGSHGKDLWDFKEFVGKSPQVESFVAKTQTVQDSQN
jgi:hypothetical protein